MPRSTGPRRRISLGDVNGRRFCFSAGLGFDGEAVRRWMPSAALRAARPGDVAFLRMVTKMVLERRGRWEPQIEIEGFGRAAFDLVANCDPYSYAGSVPLRIAPEAEFEEGSTSSRPRACVRDLPRLITYIVRGRGQLEAADVRHRPRPRSDRRPCERRCRCSPTARTSVTSPLRCSKRSAMRFLFWCSERCGSPRRVRRRTGARDPFSYDHARVLFAVHDVGCRALRARRSAVHVLDFQGARPVTRVSDRAAFERGHSPRRALSPRQWWQPRGPVAPCDSSSRRVGSSR